MQAETPSWVFLGASLHHQTKKRLVTVTTDSSRVEKQMEWRMNERTGAGPIPGPTRRLHDGLSLSRFADQCSNPTKHKLLTPPPIPPPPPNPQKVVPKWGAELLN